MVAITISRQQNHITSTGQCVLLLSVLHSLSPLSAQACVFSWRSFLFTLRATVGQERRCRNRGTEIHIRTTKHFFVLPLGVQPRPVNCPLQPPHPTTNNHRRNWLKAFICTKQQLLQLQGDASKTFAKKLKNVLLWSCDFFFLPCFD